MAKGYAMIDSDGEVFVDTVSRTKQAAMVNALFTVFKHPVFEQDTTQTIKSAFAAHATAGQKISAVSIHPVKLI